MHIFLLTSQLLLCLSCLTSPSQAAASKILLSKVKSLTLYADRTTSHRRVSAIPQLQCIGGSGRGLYDIDVMRCKNSGSEYDAEDIQWTCTASLPPEFKLGSTDVICEGYESPDDPHVLKGSCGVQYRLMLTEAGEQKYGKGGKGKRNRNQSGQGGESVMGDLFTVLFWLAFAAIVLTVLSRILGPLLGANGANGNVNRRRPGYGGGGGGGGRPDDPHDPPPPYTPRSFKSAPSQTRSPWSSSTRNDDGLFGSWRPGFWSGAATGAAAGYAMGNRQSSFNRRGGERYGEPQAGPSNWFGGRRSGDNDGFGARTNQGSSSSSSSGQSSSRYESAGFGGTTRR